MANLTPTKLLGKAGITDTLAAAAGGGDAFDNPSGRSWAEINNGGGSSITVTIAVPYTADGNAVTPPTVSIPAGARKKIGPFDPNIYNDANGRVGLTYSSVTSVTIAAYTL